MRTRKEHHLHIVLTTQQYQLLCCQAKECRLTNGISCTAY